MRRIVVFLCVVGLAWLSFGPSEAQDRTPRIVGGQAALSGDYPFLVHIYQQVQAPDHFASVCTGAIVTGAKGVLVHPGGSWILTAGHCFREPNGTDYRSAKHVVLYGNTDDAHALRAEVTRIVLNPQWFPPGVATVDAALIQVDVTIPTAYVPAVAGAGYQAPEGGAIVVAGWGVQSDLPSRVPPIQAYEIQTSITAVNNCTEIAGRLCLNNPGGKGTCEGDSGGPILSVDRIVLIGIVRSGNRLDCTNSPSSITLASVLHEWIFETVGEVSVIWKGAGSASVFRENDDRGNMIGRGAAEPIVLSPDFGRYGRFSSIEANDLTGFFLRTHTNNLITLNSKRDQTGAIVESKVVDKKSIFTFIREPGSSSTSSSGSSSTNSSASSSAKSSKIMIRSSSGKYVFANRGGGKSNPTDTFDTDHILETPSGKFVFGP